jgi:hypothetical protein
MWKRFQVAVFLLAVTVSSGLLISPYINMQHLTSPAADVTINGVQILCEDDELPPDAVAQLILNCQDFAEVGELVRFDVSESVASSFKWLMIPDSVDFEICANGQHAVFSARKPGDYEFIIACGCNDTVDVIRHIITVKRVAPPGPDEYPNISKPNANAELDKWVAYWCAVNKRPKDGADRLAGSFESIAAQIAAGVLQTANDIIQASAEANRNALGDSLLDWVPVLRELQTIMRTLAEQGKLSNPSQHQAVWEMIAKGLRHYISLFN